jgi:hypothetical protein
MLDFIHRRLPIGWRYWVLERRCNAEEARLTEAFLASLQQAAEQQPGVAERDELKRRYEAEAASKHGEATRWRVERVMLAARKWDVYVPGPPKDGEVSEKWERAPYVVRFGGWRLTEAALCEIRRTVREERRRAFTFWFSWIFGLLGLVIGLLSMLRRCPPSRP